MIEPGTRNRVERAVNRAKLHEPVLLYTVPALIALLVLLTIAGTAWWVHSVAVLIVGAGALASRASVFCEAGHFRSLHVAASRWAEMTGSRR